MSKLDIAIIQSDIVWENPDENLVRVYEKISNAKQSDIYVLPEMFNTGFTNNVEKFAEKSDGKSVVFLKNLAKEKNAAICASLILSENNKYYNSFLFVKPDGEIIRYDKRHLFKMGGEADMFTGGLNRVVCNYKNVRFLLQICYDLRFPVWSRNRNDYDAIIYIANWPSSRQYIYDTLLSARAIENQSFVIATNRIGEDGNGISYDGGSCFIDAKGKTLIKTGDNREEIIYLVLDLEEQNKYRQNFSAWQDADQFEINI